MRMWVVSLVVALCSLPVFTGIVAAAEHDPDALAKKVQNPIANLVTVPFQYNYSWGVGEYERNAGVINFQPVVPFPGEKWNVITRTIIPITSVPVGEFDSVFGLGDINMSLFWSPANPGPVVWGVGPVFYIPLSSNPEVLGSGKFSLGPTGVVFYASGRWTLGGVASIAWSVAGQDDRDDFNTAVVQYFVNYNIGQGWAVGSAPIISGDLEAASGQKWTVPFGLQIAKVTRLGSRPTNLVLGYYYNAEHPDGGAEGSVRIQVNLMYP